MTKRKLAPTEPRKWTGPNGEVWEPPPPNSPVQMKPGWLTKMQMDVANAKPVPASLLKHALGVDLFLHQQGLDLPPAPTEEVGRQARSILAQHPATEKAPPKRG
jgi:hypothetical protein